MRQALKIFLLLALPAMPGSVRLMAQDAEQEQLQLCHQFSRLLNYEIDTLARPELYRIIYSWLGTPYKYSGECRDGIDCSGFVCMLFREVYGVKLAERSADIFREARPLKRNSLQEGDLVFFKISKHRISHVGVYLANNKFVHASVQNGVIISDLNEPYYRKYFYKGGRVKKSKAD